MGPGARVVMFSGCLSARVCVCAYVFARAVAFSAWLSFDFQLPCTCRLPLVALHPFNGLFSRTTSVSRYQKGKTSLDLNEARDDGVLGWQLHQLEHMQRVCTSLQADNTSSISFCRLMLFLTAQPTVSKH